MPKYSLTAEDQDAVVEEQNPSPTVQEVIDAVYAADCIRIGEDTAKRLLAENENRKKPMTAKQIAGQFVCEQMNRDFRGDDDGFGMEPDDAVGGYYE